VVGPQREETIIAVVANVKKSMPGGLGALRRELARATSSEVRWYEAPNSRASRTLARRAVADGAQLLFVWGGDGTVQRCLNAVAGHDVTLAILPAGTANLLAMNLSIPKNITDAVAVGLHGEDRIIDAGTVNGELFGVVAGAGLDAVMMAEAQRGLKDRIGRLAYLWAGARAARQGSRRMRIKVDGERWFDGDASCVLVGQFSRLGPGVVALPNARPDDGLLDVGVVTARNVPQWARVAARIATGRPDDSPLTRTRQGRRISIRLDRRTRYELDGGPRKGTKHLRVEIQPRALVIRVPRATVTDRGRP
jgi:YegS/Rv2252/BmrU family lipid kinase